MPPSPRSPSKRPSRNVSNLSQLTWPDDTELIGLALDLKPLQTGFLYPQYTIGLHAWFLDQVRQLDPELSAYLHDGESEKAFTVSSLEGVLPTQHSQLQLQASQTYRWCFTLLSRPVIQWLAQWLKSPPTTLILKDIPLQIVGWQVIHPPTTYAQLLQPLPPRTPSLTLSFTSPTSFRRKKHHFPLPVPRNVFHSYLRRWNDFSGQEVDQEAFLDWVDEAVLIARHQMQSMKVVAGKRGAVTGFTGSVEFSIASKTPEHEFFEALFLALGRLAPYCGTGHKTTLGLGQTRLGWQNSEPLPAPTDRPDLLAERIAELTEQFTAQRQRSGGERATRIAETWATILARREMGESLRAIAQDLEMPYETTKTYVKLARRALKINGSTPQKEL